MQNKSQTVSEYLRGLPEDRRKTLEVVRKIIRSHLPKGYEEAMQYGMIGYVVPLRMYPAGYLGRPDMPLTYISLASQKNYLALYLTNVYADKEWGKKFRADYAKSGKKLDMGKSCVRFRKVEDLPLALIGKTVAHTSVKEFISLYEAARSQSAGGAKKKSKVARK